MHTHARTHAHMHTHHTASSPYLAWGWIEVSRKSNFTSNFCTGQQQQTKWALLPSLPHPSPTPPHPAPSPAQQRVAAQTSAEINAQPIPPEHQGRYGNRSTNTNRLVNIGQSPSGPAPSHQYVAARCLLLRTTLNKHLTASRTAEEGRGRGVAGGGGEKRGLGEAGGGRRGKERGGEARKMWKK